MITERGPHGTVAVVTIESDKEVVPHALSALRNRACRKFLPVYVRELFGQKQLCVDCTGLIRVIDPAVSRVYMTLEARRKAVADLLSGVIEMLDLLLDPSGLILRPEDIWLHPESGEMFFVYLPWRSLSSKSGCVLSDVDAIELENLLMHDFFSEAVSETFRHRLTDCVLKGDEAGFGRALDGMSHPDSVACAKTKRFSALSLSLSAILMLMIIVLLGIFQLSERPKGFLRAWEWAPLYSISFLLLTIGVCRKPRSINNSAPPAEMTGKASSSNKDLFFPNSNDCLTAAGGNGESTLEPGFLVEQSDYGHKLSKKRSCVIWTDDFLIGSDHLLCDYPIDHPSVSVRHARIVRRQGMFFLVDLGSRDGSYIGHRKLFTHEENPLLDGDTIRIGEVRFLFSHDDRAACGRSERCYSETVSP